MKEKTAVFSEFFKHSSIFYFKILYSSIWGSNLYVKKNIFLEQEQVKPTHFTQLFTVKLHGREYFVGRQWLSRKKVTPRYM